MMDGIAIGEAQAFLFEYRIIETKPIGRKATFKEREVADTLIQLDYEDKEMLGNLLGAQGFRLEHFNYTDMRGIPRGGQTWLLVRDAYKPCPRYISSQSVIESMSLKDSETSEMASIWFLHVWLIYLAVIYTYSGRAVTEVSGYLDANFTKEQLVNEVAEHLEKIRKLGVEGGVNQKVFDTLDSEKGKDIHKRVTLFLNGLERSKLIRKMEGNGYEQTLLGAFEIANNYIRTLGNLIPEDSMLDNIANVGTGGLAKNKQEEDIQNAIN